MTARWPDDFEDRFITFSPTQINFNEADKVYRVNDDGDEDTDFEFEDPDFNFIQFRSNLVIRWEYRPSSTLFLVWSQGTSGGADPERNVFSALSEDLFGGEVENTFLVKATYRWVR